MSEAAARPKKGKVVRISKEVEQHLRRKRKKKESFDSVLRRMFGLNDLKGIPQPLHTYWVLANEGQPMIFMLGEKDVARGMAMRLAVRRGVRKTEPVLRVQEVP